MILHNPWIQIDKYSMLYLSHYAGLDRENRKFTNEEDFANILLKASHSIGNHFAGVNKLDQGGQIHVIFYIPFSDSHARFIYSLVPLSSKITHLAIEPDYSKNNLHEYLKYTENDELLLHFIVIYNPRF